MYDVDVPPSSTIQMLMSDDDKCLSSWVICVAWTDRRQGRLLAGRSDCATIRTLCLFKLEITPYCAAMLNTDLVWNGSKSNSPWWRLSYGSQISDH